jgi:putative nucleotidyltransferase with HDIG domain
LTVHKVRRMDDSEIDFADYFPSSKRDPDGMWAELRGLVAAMSNPHLKGLLEAFLNDPDIAQRYRRAPAAKSIHHAFLGGLIEHVLSLCALAKLVAGHYKSVDADLLLTGVVLHDIGKIYELNYERDSKMECMRALVENDRQLEGCFTSYSTALERTALKMDRYLNVGQVDNLRPVDNRPAESTQAFEAPAEPVAPPPVQHPLFAPKPDSIFADKLRQALKPASAEQER